MFSLKRKTTHSNRNNNNKSVNLFPLLHDKKQIFKTNSVDTNHPIVSLNNNNKQAIIIIKKQLG